MTIWGQKLHVPWLDCVPTTVRPKNVTICIITYQCYSREVPNISTWKRCVRKTRAVPVQRELTGQKERCSVYCWPRQEWLYVPNESLFITDTDNNYDLTLDKNQLHVKKTGGIVPIIRMLEQRIDSLIASAASAIASLSSDNSMHSPLYYTVYIDLYFRKNSKVGSWKWWNRSTCQVVAVN